MYTYFFQSELIDKLKGDCNLSNYNIGDNLSNMHTVGVGHSVFFRIPMEHLLIVAVPMGR